jgi:hypothetical protein
VKLTAGLEMAGRHRGGHRRLCQPRGRQGCGGQLGPPIVDSFDGEEQQEEAEPLVVTVGRGDGRNGGGDERRPGTGFHAYREL